MDQNAKEVYLQKFNQQLHMLGRITLGVAIVLLIGAPLLMGLLYGVMPDMSGFLKGIIKVGIIYKIGRAHV